MTDYKYKSNSSQIKFDTDGWRGLIADDFTFPTLGKVTRSITTDINASTEQRDLERVRESVEFPEGKIPLTDGKPGTAELVAQLVLFLASDASRHITGIEIWIDGGESLLKA